MAITTKTGRTMNITPKNILAPVQPKVQPVVPVVQQPTSYTPWTSIDNRPVATKSGNEYVAYSQRKEPTLATRDNPMISVSTEPKPIDLNTADQATLLKEQDAINYKISTGNFTQDDYVRWREINRKLSESLYKAPEQVTNPYLTQLEQQAQSIQSRDNKPLIDARRAQLQSNLNIKRQQLEENARRARESTIGNIAMAGGWRSSVAQQAELDIQRQLQEQLNAEQAAMDLEITAYERELAWAWQKELESINQSINALKTQAAQWQTQLEQQAQAKRMEATSQFDTNLQSIARSKWIELDVNDEKAIEQFVSIARNPDWSANENFIKTLAPQYQELVRAWVSSGIGRMNFTPKVERLWGTTKNPIYWYRDPNKWQFVTTNALWVPTWWVRTWGGWAYSWWWAGGSVSQQWYAWEDTTWLYDLSLTKWNKSKLSQTTVENLSAGKNDALKALDSVEKLLESWDYTSWPLWWLATYNPAATKTISANQKFGIAAQVVGKFLEWGKLAEWDIKRYKALLPDVSDTPAVAKNKLAEAKKLIVENYNWQLDSAARAGYNLSNYKYITPKQTTKNPVSPITTPTPTKSTTKQPPKTQAVYSLFWIK